MLEMQTIPQVIQTMLFRQSDRVIYAKNPLQQVICQLRFPPLLRISTELPIDFQERLRQEYPFFQEKPEISLALQGVVEQARQAIESAVSGKPVPGYDFISTDQHWTVSLTRDFLALSTNDYRNWQDFATRLDKVKTIFEEMYAPPFYSRIGLRYQDVIRRSELGLNGVPWSELIQIHLAGVLASSELGNYVEEIFQQILFKLLRYDARARVQHGLVIPQDGTNELCYLIDNDFSTIQRTELKDARDILTYFNQENGNLFRSVITDRLKTALGTAEH
jgi:uncharacterized protein (TIGR04255 family)